jgi:hypothetical protein
MAFDDHPASPINVDDLLLLKRLQPLPPEHVADLEKIANLDVTLFNEAEVRAFIIDPLVRILGYDKGTIFSADLASCQVSWEKSIPRLSICALERELLAN